MADRTIAVVTDTLAFESSYQAFERPSDAQTLFSLVPRGIRRFFLETDTLAKPATDQIHMFITATLPENFAYVIRSCNLRMENDRAVDWEQACELRLFNHIPGQPLGTSEHLFALTTAVKGTASVKSFLCFSSASTPLSNFAGPVWSVHGGSITFRLLMTNVNTTVQGAGFVETHVEFLEYDLTQAQRYYINTPIPVLAR